MTISVTCACGREYRLEDDEARRKFNYRECETLVRIPKSNRPKTEGICDFEVDEPDAGCSEGQIRSSDPAKQTSIAAAAVIVVGSVCWFTSAKGLSLTTIPCVLFAIAVYFPFDIEAGPPRLN